MKTLIEKLAWICIGIGCIVFLIYIIKLGKSDYTLIRQIGDSDIERTGQIGDFFGGIVGSIWALAGVLLYFSALKLQSKEIANQINEMNENKKLMSQQQFETTFFNLLKTQQELKNDIKGTFNYIGRHHASFNYLSKEYSAGDFFICIVNEMRKLYTIYKKEKFERWDESYVKDYLYQYYEQRENGDDDPSYDYQTEIDQMFYLLNLSYSTSLYSIKKETIEKAQNKETEELMCKCIYGHIFLRYQNELGHYCRHLYNIVKFLDKEKAKCIADIKNNTELDSIEKRFSGYFSFVHSMLSTSELCVLFYNSLIFPNAKELYVKYHLFNNLLQENLLKKRHAQFITGATLKTGKDIFQEIVKDMV